MPRSVYLLALTLALLVVTSFAVRPPAKPAPLKAQPADATDSIFKPPPPGAASSQSAPGAQTLNPTQTGGASSLPGPDARAGTQAATGDAPHATNSGAPGDAGPRALEDDVSSKDGATAGAGLTNNLQHAIRQAFGAADDVQPANDRRASAPGSRNPESGDGRQGDGRQGDARGPGTDPNQVDRNAASHPQGDRAPVGGSKAGPPSGGAGAAAGEDGLFAAQPGAAPRRGTDSEPMALKLTAFAGVAPSHQAPQRDAPPVAGQVAVIGGGGSAPAPTDEQVPDAALQKAEVAPEHEAIVQRIFTRDE